MLEIATNRDLMLPDNLHPNDKAQPIIRDFMFEEIDLWLKS
jgi:acyl-CoA thioesterase-1